MRAFLPPFPVDPGSLDLLLRAVDPPAEEQATTTSLFATLDMFSRLGGSNTSTVDGPGGVQVLRGPQYSVNDLVAALIGEIRRLRARLGENGPTYGGGGPLACRTDDGM